VRSREIVGLIGPNGAGKTTVFNLLTNVYRPSTGGIRVAGESTLGKSPHEVTRHGIARTFQNIRLFKSLSVMDNVKIALHNSMRCSLLESCLRLPSYWKEEARAAQVGRELLSVFGMENLEDVPAQSLPYGAQRRLEIARALATGPKVLLLDEPAAGMNPSETDELMDTIYGVRDRFGVAIILIEHDMSLVMRICERILVLNHGLVIAQGTPDEIRNDPLVVEAYLGQEGEEEREEEGS
jgi:branched-chain amino acid transport system ATP-binding protein